MKDSPEYLQPKLHQRSPLPETPTRNQPYRGSTAMSEAPMTPTTIAELTAKALLIHVEVFTENLRIYEDKLSKQLELANLPPRKRLT